MSQLIAVKLGSSNTSIFKQGEGLVLFEPTLVAFRGEPRAREVIAVGRAAERMQGRTDGSIVVSAPIVEGRVVDSELATIMLKSYLARVVAGALLKPRIKAAVCVPLGITLKERKEIEWVCHHAGIQDVVFVPAIMAGAVGYNLPISDASGMCLVNIGGGSTDIATISVNSIISGINVGIGGIVLDKAIEKAIASEYNLKIGEGVAKKLKEEIGSLYPNDASNAEVCGVDIESGAAKSVVVEAKTVYDAIVGFYDKLADAIHAVIVTNPANIVEDIQNQGIYLMGGASLVTGAEQFFRKRLNMPVLIQDQTTAIDTIGAGKLLSDVRLMKVISNQ